MSALDDVTILCEGEDGGLDVRMLDLALKALSGQSPIAQRATIRPAGSKVDLAPAIRARRDILRTKNVFAVRDRDFLPSGLMLEHCAACGKGDARPYPLRRYCIESYLLDGDVLEGATGIRDAESLVRKLAEVRRWTDVCRASLERVGFEVRQSRVALGSVAGAAMSEADATAIVQSCVVRFSEQVAEDFSRFDAGSVVREVARDFDEDGPLWLRVDGKALLNAVEARLRESGALRGGDLARTAWRRLEKVGPPAGLVTDLEAALRTFPIR